MGSSTSTASSAGENNQYYPALYEGLTPVEPEKTPEEGYHLTEDLADHAIDWVRTQKALVPDKPFFMYFAPGATHAPHHVPQEWADKYKGQFADGWDRQREVTFERQKELGVIGPDAELTARHDEIPAWDEMPEELKPVLEREMEVYAGFLEHTDHHVGRLIDAIEELGVLDDTLIYYIIGDNGASAEGTINGAFNEMANFNGMAALETPEFMVSKLTSSAPRPPTTTTRSAGRGRCTRRTSGPSRSPRTGAAPATARSCTGPMASTERGRDPVAVQPRDRRGAHASSRRRVSRATVGQRGAAVPHRGDEHGLQLRRRRCARAPRPAVLRDVRQPRHLPQGLERRDQAPHPVGAGRASSCRRSTTTSGSSTTAARTGRKPTIWPPSCRTSCTSLQRLWLIEAVKYNVLPIDDRGVERLNPDDRRPAQLITGTSQLLFPGMKRLSENSVINIKNRSFSVTAADRDGRRPRPRA